MKRPLLAALALLALAVAAPAGAQEGAITIRPALFDGIAQPSQRIGPLTIANTTATPIDVEVFPVLLEQRPDGGVSVRQDEAARAEALRLLHIVGPTRFTLRPGKARSLAAVLRARSTEDNFYGGILFQATPRQKTTGSSSITQIFQLNARVLLRPPKALARPAFELTGIRGEQSGAERIRLLAAVENTGNVALMPRGRVRIRDERGQVRFTGRLEELEIFPGAEVELAAEFAEPVLPAGRYEVAATVTAAGQKESISAPLELFGPNELPTRKARLLALSFPQAYVDEGLTITATYRNTGNVPFTPRATLIAGSGTPIPMAAEQVAPGKTGTARASVRLAGRQSRELTVKLFAEGRELDARTVSVTPLPRPSLADRLQDWILTHAILLVAALGGAVLVMAISLAVVLIRRLRRKEKEPALELDLLTRLAARTAPLSSDEPALNGRTNEAMKEPAAPRGAAKAFARAPLASAAEEAAVEAATPASPEPAPSRAAPAPGPARPKLMFDPPPDWLAQAEATQEMRVQSTASPPTARERPAHGRSPMVERNGGERPSSGPRGNGPHARAAQADKISAGRALALTGAAALAIVAIERLRRR
jgi:hypothetical protein